MRYLVALAAGLERGVADDAAQPEPETGGLAQLAQVLVGDQKRLLHHVASQLEVGEQTHGRAIGVVLVAVSRHRYGLFATLQFLAV